MIAHFGNCELDFGRRELRRGQELIHVEPQVFDLLVYLIDKRDRVVSKDEILEAVWHGRIVSDATLSSRINAARMAVGDSGRSQTLIRTIPRRGFRFVGDKLRFDTPIERTTILDAQRSARQQRITFCKTPDGVRLAVAVAGEGEGELVVKTANWLNHVEYDWQSPIWSPTFARLAAHNRLVRYDERGTGLSDWNADDISFEAFVRDLETVIEALRLERFALFGLSQGCAVAMAYAARHPERVTKLVLHGGFALGPSKRHTVADDERASAFLTLIRHGWGYPNSAFMQAFSSLYLPDATVDQVKWFADLQRLTTSPENAIRIREAVNEIDIVDLLPKIRAPTLVTHNRRDNVVPFSHGLMIASSIPGARFVELDSANHPIIPYNGSWELFMTAVEEFLA